MRSETSQGRKIRTKSSKKKRTEVIRKGERRRETLRSRKKV